MSDVRIDAYNKVNQIYQTSKTRSSEPVKKTGTFDQVEFSRRGQEFQLARKTIQSTPQVRMERVNELKKRIELGTYEVALDDVADRLMDTYFDQRI